MSVSVIILAVIGLLALFSLIVLPSAYEAYSTSPEPALVRFVERLTTRRAVGGLGR